MILSQQSAPYYPNSLHFAQPDGKVPGFLSYAQGLGHAGSYDAFSTSEYLLNKQQLQPQNNVFKIQSANPFAIQQLANPKQQKSSQPIIHNSNFPHLSQQYLNAPSEAKKGLDASSKPLFVTAATSLLKTTPPQQQSVLPKLQPKQLRTQPGTHFSEQTDYSLQSHALQGTNAPQLAATGTKQQPLQPFKRDDHFDAKTPGYLSRTSLPYRQDAFTEPAKLLADRPFE